MTALVKRHAFSSDKAHRVLKSLVTSLRHLFHENLFAIESDLIHPKVQIVCSHCTMSTALVSAFYDINDVIQQSKQRPSSLDFRQRVDRKTNGTFIARRHSTTLSLKGQIIGSNGTFYTLPSSPSEKTFSFPSARDRSLSASVQEEVEAQHRVNKRGSTNSTRYKTELCRPFEENGTCKYGDKCQFAHGVHELRNMSRHPKYKTELCRTYHTIGFCPYGPRCHFIHNDDEKRAPPTPGSHRSSSVSSLNSGPPSPVMDPLPSPFSSSLTPPASPSYGGDVFVFGDEVTSIPHSPSPPTPASVSPPGALHVSDHPMPFSPQPPPSDFAPLTPLASTPPHHPATGLPSPGLEEDRSSPDFRLPPSPTDSLNSRRNGARLPIFSQIA